MLKQISQGIGCCRPNIRVVVVLLERDETFVNTRIVDLILGTMKALYQTADAHANPFSCNGG